MLALGISNHNSQSRDLILHLELLANSENDELAIKALLMTARLYLAEGRPAKMHSVLTQAV